jgi:hypothetical protein
VYQAMALNSDERYWLADARREREEARYEEGFWPLGFLVSAMAEYHDASELEYVAHRLWAEAQLKRLQEEA